MTTECFDSILTVWSVLADCFFPQNSNLRSIWLWSLTTLVSVKTNFTRFDFFKLIIRLAFAQMKKNAPVKYSRVSGSISRQLLMKQITQISRFVCMKFFHSEERRNQPSPKCWSDKMRVNYFAWVTTANVKAFLNH